MTDDETRLDWAKDLPNHLPPGTKRGWDALYGGPPMETPRFTLMDGYYRDANGHYWHPSAVSHLQRHGNPLDETKIMEVLQGGKVSSEVRVAPATRHVSRRVYRSKQRRSPVRRALLWAAILVVVAGTMAAAVPVAGMACLAYCPVP